MKYGGDAKGTLVQKQAIQFSLCRKRTRVIAAEREAPCIYDYGHVHLGITCCNLSYVNTRIRINSCHTGFQVQEPVAQV